MWQFIPSTGRGFDLRQNIFRDDRRDVQASTRAALDYLQKLHDQFGDWHLALAAYNWGEGNVTRAIERNRRLGLPTGYQDLKMPAETRHYVPKLEAIKNIVSSPRTFDIHLPIVPNHPYFRSITLEHDMDVYLVVRLAQIELDEFRALNPSINGAVILAAGSRQLLLPWDNAALFEKNLGNLKNTPLASWTAWVAPSTMRAQDAATQVGMHVDQLRKLNKIPPSMLIKGGSTLLVRRASDVAQDVSSDVADNGQVNLLPDGHLQKTQKTQKTQKIQKGAKTRSPQSSRKGQHGGHLSHAAHAKKKTGSRSRPRPHRSHRVQ
jgi:membrane-bound lytic murein transglycosylase D